MQALRQYVHTSALLAAVALFSVPLPASTPNAVSLKVLDEIVPRGGMVQMKVFVTEPKPISTGRGRISSSVFRSASGIALMSAGDDARGVAVVSGSDMTLSVVSPGATFGMQDDYPVLTVASRVASTTPIGTVVPFTIDPIGLVLKSATGAAFPVEVENGSYTVTGQGLGVDDVQPGSASLGAGAVVRILGRGFQPTTRVRFNEVALSQTRFISSNRIDVVLGQAARMHGMRIRVENSSGPRVTYYSYQRTTRAGSSLFPVLQSAVPLLPTRFFTTARIPLGSGTTGIAVQNLQSAPATVALDLLSPAGAQMATVTTSLLANQFFLKAATELFQIGYPAGSSVRVRSATPLQVMGVGLSTGGDATPILPR